MGAQRQPPNTHGGSAPTVLSHQKSSYTAEDDAPNQNLSVDSVRLLQQQILNLQQAIQGLDRRMTNTLHASPRLTASAARGHRNFQDGTPAAVPGPKRLFTGKQSPGQNTKARFLQRMGLTPATQQTNQAPRTNVADMTEAEFLHWADSIPEYTDLGRYAPRKFLRPRERLPPFAQVPVVIREYVASLATDVKPAYHVEVNNGFYNTRTNTLIYNYCSSPTKGTSTCFLNPTTFLINTLVESISTAVLCSNHNCTEYTAARRH
jgi:hypothetical protein